MSSNRAGPVWSRTGVRSMITVTYLSPRRVCRQTCSSTPITATPSNRCGSSISSALTFGEDGVVGGVPRHPEAVGDPGDGEVLHHQPFQRPPQSAAGQLRPRLRGPAGVLAPHMPALAAAVAAHGDVQAGRSPAERLVRQPPDHGAARDSLAAAAVAPVVGVDDPAREHGTVRIEALPGHDEPELVEAAEHGQVRAAEAGIRGSVVHRRGLP